MIAGTGRASGPISEVEHDDVPRRPDPGGCREEDSGCSSSHTTCGQRDAFVETGATHALRPRGKLVVRAVLIAALLACRVGEALNPGPAMTRSTSSKSIKLVDAAWRKAVEYPPPHRDGFRDIASPGFVGRRSEGERRRLEEDFRLIVETTNSTGWGPLRRRLLDTSAHVVLAQETWVLPDQMARASSWARRNGWHSLWAPAATGPGGGASGGVAILARAELGLRHPIAGSHVLHEARAVAGFVDPPGHRPILLASVYLKDGKGMSTDNKDIPARVGECAAAQGEGCLPLVAGDFQCGPHEVANSGFPDQIHGRIMAAQTARGTFRTKAAASTLDFFVAAHSLAEVIEQVATVERSGVKGHVPVQAAFAPRPVALKALALRRPPDLELERVYGPLPPPQPWDGARRAAAAALKAATHGAAKADLQQSIDDAYEQWCYAAEEEVADVTGSSPKKWKLRGQMPRLKWASVLPECAPRGAPSAAAAATHMRGFTQELTRIIGLVETEAGGGFYADPLPAELNRPHGATFATPIRGGYDSGRRAAAANPRGGRPRPPTDLARCEEVVTDIIEEITECIDHDHTNSDMHARYHDTIGLARRVLGAVRQARDTGYHSDEQLNYDMQQLGESLTETEKAAERERDKEEYRRWKEWLEEDWHAGGRHAHAATKAPIEWRPTVAVADDGTRSAAPAAILEECRTKYAKYWRAGNRPIEHEWAGGCQPLPRLTAEQLRSASLAFARRTASTYDGWHVRHFGLLCDAGLEVLGMLLEAIERSSRWPSQVTLVTSTMIDKPRGGHRLIGKMPARGPWTPSTDRRCGKKPPSLPEGRLPPFWKTWSLSMRLSTGRFS